MRCAGGSASLLGYSQEIVCGKKNPLRRSPRGNCEKFRRMGTGENGNWRPAVGEGGMGVFCDFFFLRLEEERG